MLTKGLHPRTGPHPAAASSDSERLACACPSRAGLPLMSTLGSRPARRGAGPTMAPKLRARAPGPGRAPKPPNSPSRMHMRAIGDASEGFARLPRAIPTPAPPPPPRGALRPRRGCPHSRTRPRWRPMRPASRPGGPPAGGDQCAPPARCEAQPPGPRRRSGAAGHAPAHQRASGRPRLGRRRPAQLPGGGGRHAGARLCPHEHGAPRPPSASRAATRRASAGIGRPRRGARRGAQSARAVAGLWWEDLG